MSDVFLHDCRMIDVSLFNIGLALPLRGQTQKAVDFSGSRVTNFTMRHINGYTFELKPTKVFRGMEPGTSEVLRILGGGWAVSRSEVWLISIMIY